jgi:uncharacterized phage-associated protein
MNIHANIIANEFIRLAKEKNKPLENMQVQQLVYVAHGFHLALLGSPIFFNHTHAWQWGPVIPNLYKKLQRYSCGIVESCIKIPKDQQKELSEDSLAIVHGVFLSYSKYTGGELLSLSHQPESPWKVVWDKNPFSIIPNELIQEHYKKKICGCCRCS